MFLNVIVIFYLFSLIILRFIKQVLNITIIMVIVILNTITKMYDAIDNYFC